VFHHLFNLYALSEMKVDEKNNIINIEQGDARLKVSFLNAEKLSFRQIKGFPEAPPEHGEPDQWHVYATTGRKSTSSKYMTLLVPFRQNDEPEIKVVNIVENQDEVSLELIIEGKSYYIDFMPEIRIRKAN